MQTVKLSDIVLRWFPDLMPSLKAQELNIQIVLRNGIKILEADDAMEIIHRSICEYQSIKNLH